jgi:hypothetical protein
MNMDSRLMPEGLREKIASCVKPTTSESVTFV